MRAVRILDEIGAGSHSICYKRLFVGIVLRLIANQDAVFGRSWIYVVRFSFVSDEGNFAGRQRGHSLLLLRRSYGEWSKPRLHQQRFFLRRSTGTDGSCLARCHES